MDKQEILTIFIILCFFCGTAIILVLNSGFTIDLPSIDNIINDTTQENIKVLK
jgi:hypothetical protein